MSFRYKEYNYILEIILIIKLDSLWNSYAKAFWDRRLCNYVLFTYSYIYSGLSFGYFNSIFAELCKRIKFQFFFFFFLENNIYLIDSLRKLNGSKNYIIALCTLFLVQHRYYWHSWVNECYRKPYFQTFAMKVILFLVVVPPHYPAPFSLSQCNSQGTP